MAGSKLGLAIARYRRVRPTLSTQAFPAEEPRLILSIPGDDLQERQWCERFDDTEEECNDGRRMAEQGLGVRITELIFSKKIFR